MSKEIQCDYCKFCDICFDYGWENCQKYTPAPKAEQTNEEWFTSLTTEEKAKYIAKAMYFYSEEFGLTMLEALQRSVEYEQGLNRTIENDVVEWLKAVHK